MLGAGRAGNAGGYICFSGDGFQDYSLAESFSAILSVLFAAIMRAILIATPHTAAIPPPPASTMSYDIFDILCYK